MTNALRPMSRGEILDGTIQMHRSRLAVYLAISAIATAAIMSISVADRLWFHVRASFPPGRPPGNWIRDPVARLGLVHIQSLIGPVSVPAALRQTWCEMFGSLGFGLRRWRSFLWIGALKLLLGALAAETAAAILIMGTAFIVYLADPSIAPGAVAAIVLLPGLAGLIAAQWLSACFSLSVAGAAVEDLRGMAALLRSWTLTRERRWPIQFPWIALLVSEIVLYYVFGYLLRWGWMMAWRAWRFPYWRIVLDGTFYVLNIVLSSLIGPIFTIALTLIYYDQRIRKEGYDIERMMDAAGLSAPAMPATAGAGDSAEAEVQPG